MRLITVRSTLLAAASVCFPALGSAHHSFAASYEFDGDLEIAGDVVEVRWRNPHVEFDVRVTDEDGTETIWTVEGDSLSGFRGRNITEPFVAVGDQVRLAGFPGRRGDKRIAASNVLLPTNQELVLRGEAEPRFTDQVVDTSGNRNITRGDSSSPGLGLFRVWSTTQASSFPFPEDVDPALAHTDFPLTSAARLALEAFDPIDDSPILNCALKGMPTIMEQPYPMEIIEQDGNVLLHMEEYDLLRTIYMNEATTPEPTAGILGFSVGHWEDNTLIVNTSHLSWGWYDTVGIPLSENATIVEELTLHKDGSQLDWTMTVNDPATFTEPVVLEKFWLYIPGVEVRSFDCAPEVSN